VNAKMILKNLYTWLGVVVHIYKSNYWRGRGSKTKTGLDKIINPYPKKQKTKSKAKRLRVWLKCFPTKQRLRIQTPVLK
jgi:hypothetical protein